MLAILRFLEAVFDWTDEFSGIPKGLLQILLVVIMIWLVVYFWIFQSFFGGYHVRGLWILGIWAVIELANWIGGN